MSNIISKYPPKEWLRGCLNRWKPQLHFLIDNELTNKVINIVVKFLGDKEMFPIRYTPDLDVALENLSENEDKVRLLIDKAIKACAYSYSAVKIMNVFAGAGLNVSCLEDMATENFYLNNLH